MAAAEAYLLHSVAVLGTYRRGWTSTGTTWILVQYIQRIRTYL